MRRRGEASAARAQEREVPADDGVEAFHYRVSSVRPVEGGENGLVATDERFLCAGNSPEGAKVEPRVAFLDDPRFCGECLARKRAGSWGGPDARVVSVAVFARKPSSVVVP